MPFIGSEALRDGLLTRGQLRWNYTAVHPDIYIHRRTPRTLEVNTRAAALWVPDGIVTGRAGAALHGAAWVDADTPVEVIGRGRRPRDGVVVREERIGDDEIVRIGGLAVATPARTALDLARHLRRGRAIPHLDALAAATGLHADAALSLAEGYRGARGVRRARSTLPLLDAGAQSPRESWLRLLLIDAGFPRPRRRSWCPTGTPSPRSSTWAGRICGSAMEYDGEEHRADRRRFVKDIGRHEVFTTKLGWLMIRVVKEHSRNFILARVHEAFRQRDGYRLARPA